jgi:hypothetical protein
MQHPEKANPDELMAHLTSISGDKARTQLAGILLDCDCQKAILAWRGKNAQSMINFLQMVRLYY